MITKTWSRCGMPFGASPSLANMGADNSANASPKAAAFLNIEISFFLRLSQDAGIAAALRTKRAGEIGGTLECGYYTRVTRVQNFREREDEIGAFPAFHRRDRWRGGVQVQPNSLESLFEFQPHPRISGAQNEHAKFGEVRISLDFTRGQRSIVTFRFSAGDTMMRVGIYASRGMRICPASKTARNLVC